MSDLGLLFYVVDDSSDVTVRRIEEFVGQLAGARDWTLTPPVFVNEIDEDSCSDPDDVPIRTLGGFLELEYPNDPPNSPREALFFQDVSTVIDRLIKLSEESGHEIEIEYAGEFIGMIRNGKADEGITEGLLGEWRRNLDRDEI